MEYLCVSVTKELVAKQVFSKESEAMECFERRFEQLVYDSRQRRRVRLEKGIQKYEEKIKQQIINIQEWEREGTWNYADYITLEMFQMRLEAKEERLEALMRIFDKRPVSYEKKYDTYKRKLEMGVPQLILHIGSIYERVDGFEVVEEKYYCLAEELNSEMGVEGVCIELSEAYHKDKLFWWIAPAEKGRERMAGKLAKQRAQIVGEYHRNKKRRRQQELE